jgi:SAM-dependent methyltransferase
MSDVQQAYSRWSARYVELLGTLDAVDPDDLALVDRYLGGLPGPLLDLGCGPGHLTGFLHSRGRDVTGVDLVPEFVAHARAAHPGVPFEQGSLLELDRPDASVVGVLAWFSLIHLDDLDAGLAEVARLLLPGGTLVAGFFVGPVHETFAHRVVTAHRYPAAELTARLAAVGLVEVEVQHRVQTSNQRPYVAIVARAG